jgi:tetratricopeptide (TPR) repeat protein
LVWILPLVQVVWVNSQGLFVLGPALFGAGLVDAALSPGEARDNLRRWWSLVLPAFAATAFACLINPFGLEGATFPLRLAGTMSNPVFESIGELMPLDKFVANAGWRNVPLGIYLATMTLGLLSFLVPLVWSLWRWGTRGRRGATKGKARRSNRLRSEGLVWRPSIFRLLVFAAFAILSVKATRNSHQFAAVAGTVTAWNFGEWSALLAYGRKMSSSGAEGLLASRVLLPRACVLMLLLLLCGSVMSGSYYAFQGEGRTFGLGEKRFWFPHAAVRAAGADGMPERFVCFHLGHAAVWEYHQGPNKPVYCDARLEVIGPALYQEYMRLQRAISDGAGWESWFASQGNPGVVVDLVQADSSGLAAAFLASPEWACVWFDPIAAVFVHKSFPAARNRLDFRRRHFEPDRETEPRDADELIAVARAYTYVSSQLAGPKLDTQGRAVRMGRPDLAAQLTLLGHGYARRAVSMELDRFEGWKLLGQLESQRIDRSLGPRRPGVDAFDPTLDLSMMRATVALERALARNPDDLSTIISLAELFQSRAMLESALPLLEQVTEVSAGSRLRQMVRTATQEQLPRIRELMGPEPSLRWNNRDELERLYEDLLRRGRKESAAKLLETAYPARVRSWEQSDRLATLWLHLGFPDRARSTWMQAHHPPRPALVSSRLGFVELVAGDEVRAREHFQRAVEGEPALFEAWYGLAVLECDAGRLNEAREAISKAAQFAPGPDARRAVDRLEALVALPVAYSARNASTGSIAAARRAG